MIGIEVVFIRTEFDLGLAKFDLGLAEFDLGLVEWRAALQIPQGSE